VNLGFIGVLIRIFVRFKFMNVKICFAYWFVNINL
jgi:hypothetical protein